MLRLEIVSLFGAEQNVIEMYYFTGTFLEQVRREETLGEERLLALGT